MSTFNLTNYINSDTSNVLYSEIREDNPNFVIECLNFIDQLNKEYHKLNRDFYVSLYEAGNNEYIVENTFNNFFESVGKIISKLLKFIKTLFDKFVILLNKLIGNDNYIKNNKGKLDKFNSDCEFYIDGFIFTFRDNVPLINAQKEFDNDLINLVNSSKDIKKANELFINKLNDGYFDKFRATVIGKKGQSILSEDYNDELYKLFRNNENEKGNIKIDKSQVNNSLDRFSNYKTIKDSIERLKKEIENQYIKIQNEFKTEFNEKKKLEILNKFKGLPDTSTLQIEDISKDFDIFLKNKIDQIQSMSRVHSLAFSSKLQAVKDCVKQDKQILYGALSKVSSIHESVIEDDEILTEAALGSFKTFFKKYDELTQKQLSTLQETGQFERLRPYIIKQIDRCRTIEELEDLRTDATIGVSQLNNMKSIIEQSMRVRSVGKRTKQYPTSLQPKRVQMQIDWINSVYKVAINNKIKRIKSLTESFINKSAVKFEEYTTESVDYLSAQANLQMEQIMTDYIYKESVILKENKSPVEILIIQEALIKNIKEWWNRLMEAIAKMWAKFLEFIKFHFSKETTYLTKYKDTIKNKPCKDNYKMFEYWKQENKLLTDTIPSWNFSTLKQYLASDEDFIDKYFREYRHDKLDYKEYAKEIFRGGSEAKEIKASNIPLNRMYDFCLNYETLSKKLENDMKELDNCSVDTIKLINENDRERPSETTPDTKTEATAYSHILKSYITEVDTPQIVKQDNSKEGEVNKAAKNNGAEKMSNIKKDENYDEKEDIKNNSSSSEDIQLAKRYLTICYGFLQVKMQILQETFKAYIYVLRNHVVSYLGKEKEDNETTSGTDKKKEEDKPTDTGNKSILGRAKEINKK